MMLTDLVRPAVIGAVTAAAGSFLAAFALSASEAPAALFWIVGLAFTGAATARVLAVSRAARRERLVTDIGGGADTSASEGAPRIPSSGTRVRSRRRRIEQLLEDNAALQAALLPEVPSQIGALLTTVAYRPADGPAGGGDFYDAFELPGGRVGLLLGDISGHGRQALAKTTLVRFTVRAHLEAGLSPREAIAIAGRSLDGRLSDDFATVIAAVHDPDKGTLTYASAGHPPPIVVGPPRHRPVTVSSAPPIGVGFPTGQRQTVLPMPDGTSVLLCSDGLLEARIDGVPIGSQRLGAWLAELGPDATARALLDRVIASAGAIRDDLTACVLHAAPGARAPAARVEQVTLDVLDTDGPDLDGFLAACGVSQSDRLIVCRRVSEQLDSTGSVVIDIEVGEHPTVSIALTGDNAGGRSRESA
ncbi:MAG: serine/threonine-protein phosphatase [Actinobacteria bacterium]|nr:serine/threonine-protein phosphatase [Actinomycetota bacterium]